jgi:alpha-glucosidase
MQIGRTTKRMSAGDAARALLSGTTALAGLVLMASPSAAQTALGVTSPDGHTRLTVSAEAGLHYTVDHDGAPVLAESPMGLFTSQGSIGGEAVTVLASEATSVNDSYAPLAGKASQVADRYNQLTLHLQRRKDDVRFDVVLRAYDDGVAFRFVVPGQARFQNLDVFWETTGFYFPADYGCWGANAGKFENSHETEFSAFKASAMWGFHLYDAPLVCKTGKGQTTFALLEADKRDYAGAYYTRRGDYGLGVNVGLTPRVDNARDTGTFGAAVHASLVDAPLTTPWRVVMIGDRPGRLIDPVWCNCWPRLPKLPTRAGSSPANRRGTGGMAGRSMCPMRGSIRPATRPISTSPNRWTSTTS